MRSWSPAERDRLAQAHFVQASRDAKNNKMLSAARHFRRAALLGHKRAMYYLGMQFLQGKGVPKSAYHAYCWLTLADVFGDTSAAKSLNKASLQLTSREEILASRLAADRFEQICDLEIGEDFQDQSFTR
ncbi:MULTISPECIES: sel1 repeat family protein [Gammaproteobacteria]|uniref:sel1 repeat family protein n=1 Tax=Gammaproteobacteria TaxID=1236 RepID=UPI000DCF84CC|nr:MULTISPECIES: sel1 repeat family protein [Gammaproteobacteria]RTE87048.1 sel1 repeat family protein [Aliidiomarina sp. B3213]TCZ93162.1 sel1 repeat family protein [Lysobacter sp. N42]